MYVRAERADDCKQSYIRTLEAGESRESTERDRWTKRTISLVQDVDTVKAAQLCYKIVSSLLRTLVVVGEADASETGKPAVHILNLQDSRRRFVLPSEAI